MHAAISPPVLSFLLVPDGSAARRVRRVIAERSACSGVVVGAWPELVNHACNAYFVPALTDDWQGVFRDTLGGLEDVFWSNSFAVAPGETSEALGAALTQVLSATAPTGGAEMEGLSALPDRPRRRLLDLLHLERALAGRLPNGLATIRQLLSAEGDGALRHLRVYHLEGVPSLTRWQAALIEKLNHDARIQGRAGMPEETLAGTLRAVLIGSPREEGQGALRRLQAELFGVSHEKAALDESVQWIGVRDFLQEVEVAAGMVQTLLTEAPALKPADIGLLIPDRLEYAFALEDAFRLGGLALSGLPGQSCRRDLGREAVFHFLYCRQKPAPPMALAACLSSPLMPWSPEIGTMLAQGVMDGDYRLRPPPWADREGRAMLGLLREGDTEPATLAEALGKFVALLSGGNAPSEHIQQAREAMEQIARLLSAATEVDWVRLRRAVEPAFIASGESPDFNIEGVTVWREPHEPWRAVRRLIVLGFFQGHYPSALGSNPVFSAEDIQSLRDHIGLNLTSPSEERARRRRRFVRQLSAVSDSVTFLIPRRDPSGAVQSPSETLVFMHQLFTGPESAEDLIFELDSPADRARIRHLALAASQPFRPPRVLLADDMHFDRDLLVSRTDGEDGLRPESPSSLETLMVSPLAWLLRRLDAEPRSWAPMSAEVSLLGTLAHKVFEELFGPGRKLPEPDEIPWQVGKLLDEAIHRLAPFLMASQWQVERRHFVSETVKAAQVWRVVLARLGAEILASEAWLQGNWAGVPVHGQSDLIVGLPGDRLLVVDYKRSKSKSRRQRMEKGYDSQASLYRAMLQSGGPKDREDEGLRTWLGTTARTGIVYYMLNDQISLSDATLPESGAIPGWHAVENDVAGRAMALIERRIAAVRQGDLSLNRGGDAEFFEKEAGIKPYALKVSPLIGLFTLPADAGEAK